MLFITNRVLKQGLTPVPKEGEAVRLARDVDFVLENNQAEQSFYCCRRTGPEGYTEIGSANLFDEIKSLNVEQLLFYIHGFSTLPEQAFAQAEKLQQLLNNLHQTSVNNNVKSQKIAVIPIIWPCDNDMGQVQDYFDDQKAADASGTAYMRLLQKFLAWRDGNSTLDNPCLKRVNVLAFSMGNRVLRGALQLAAKYYPQNSLGLMFRNVFLASADVVNESLEPRQEGEVIPVVSRNTVVYFAADDLALRASKVANVGSDVASRRLGHTGPENMEKVPRNVYAIDCDDFNNQYDDPIGHTYFLDDPATGEAGLVLRHAWHCMQTGRVPVSRSSAPTTAASRLNILREPQPPR
jgi:esterase/lipase superfamily enzyme